MLLPVLARKYRPQNFAEVIGQDAMVRTLSNAIASGRIAQAFMLTGVRGIGKTTTARIIARALNCVGPDGKGGPTIEPCGVCEHCTAIAQEALANIARHARAREVHVTLDADRRELALTIKDDGAGFDQGQPERGQGLPVGGREGFQQATRGGPVACPQVILQLPGQVREPLEPQGAQGSPQLVGIGDGGLGVPFLQGLPQGGHPEGHIRLEQPDQFPHQARLGPHLQEVPERPGIKDGKQVRQGSSGCLHRTSSTGRNRAMRSGWERGWTGLRTRGLPDGRPPAAG